MRKDLISRHSSIDKKINQSLRAAKKSGWVPDNAEVTIRSGRLVIPVSAAHKRKIRGFIHDESATGQTVYIDGGISNLKRFLISTTKYVNSKMLNVGK